MASSSDVITSPANPRVKHAARLRDAAARRDTGLTLVDGRRELARAVEADIEIVEVFVDADMAPDTACRQLLDSLAARGVELVSVARRPFEKIAFGSRNEGVIAVVRFTGRPLSTLAVVPDRPVLVVEGVEKPGNLGAILRTADASALAGVIACGPGTDPANPAAIRASLGTVFTVPLAVATPAEAIAWCAAGDRRVIAATPDGRRPWHETTLAGPTAIVLGSEAHGLSAAWREAADAGRIRFETIRLPMLGRADSLNVAATAAVLAYEMVRQSSLPPPLGANRP
jgi:TrmH family RNA methyltransferase